MEHSIKEDRKETLLDKIQFKNTAFIEELIKILSELCETQQEFEHKMYILTQESEPVDEPIGTKGQDVKTSIPQMGHIEEKTIIKDSDIHQVLQRTKEIGASQSRVKEMLFNLG